jgi:putative MATE family efflux protein
MVWLADVAFIGRLGANALSATGLAGQTYFFILFLFGSAGTAVTAMVSRRVGAGQEAEAARVAGQLSAVGGALGLVVTALVWFGSPAIFAAARLGPEVAAAGVLYQRILSLGATLFLFRGVLAGAMHGFGDTRSPMVVAGVAGLFNVFGDWALVNGRLGLPAMGVAGAAVASLGAHVLGAALTLAILGLRLTPARVNLRQALSFERPVLITLWRLALPASGEHLLTDLSRTVGVFMIARLGAVALAGHEVTAAAESLSFMPGWGFAIAASIMVGQSLGRGDPERAKLAVSEALRIAVAFGAIMAGLFVIAPGPLVRIFTPDVAVTSVASRLLRIAGLAQPFVALQGVFTGALRGAGDTRSPMIAGGVSAWLVRTSVTYVAVIVMGWPVEWAWWAMTGDWAVRSVWVWLVYRRGRWQEVRV